MEEGDGTQREGGKEGVGGREGRAGRQVGVKVLAKDVRQPSLSPSLPFPPSAKISSASLEAAMLSVLGAPAQI